MVSYIISQAFVVFSYVAFIFSYKSKKRKGILIFNLISSFLAALSYLLLSAYAGMAMNIVACIRNVIFLLQKKQEDSTKITKADNIIIIALMMIILSFAVFTYDGIGSLIAIVGSLLFTFSIWQKNPDVYRVFGIIVSTLWIVYNIYVCSVLAIVLETAVLVFILYNVISEKIKFSKLVDEEIAESE